VLRFRPVLQGDADIEEPQRNIQPYAFEPHAVCRFPEQIDDPAISFAAPMHFTVNPLLINDNNLLNRRDTPVVRNFVFSVMPLGR